MKKQLILIGIVFIITTSVSWAGKPGEPDKTERQETQGKSAEKDTDRKAREAREEVSKAAQDKEHKATPAKTPEIAQKPQTLDAWRTEIDKAVSAGKNPRALQLQFIEFLTQDNAAQAITKEMKSNFDYYNNPNKYPDFILNALTAVVTHSGIEDKNKITWAVLDTINNAILGFDRYNEYHQADALKLLKTRIIQNLNPWTLSPNRWAWVRKIWPPEFTYKLRLLDDPNKLSTIIFKGVTKKPDQEINPDRRANTFTTSFNTFATFLKDFPASEKPFQETRARLIKEGQARYKKYYDDLITRRAELAGNNSVFRLLESTIEYDLEKKQLLFDIIDNDQQKQQLAKLFLDNIISLPDTILYAFFNQFKNDPVLWKTVTPLQFLGLQTRKLLAPENYEEWISLRKIAGLDNEQLNQFIHTWNQLPTTLDPSDKNRITTWFDIVKYLGFSKPDLKPTLINALRDKLKKAQTSPEKEWALAQLNALEKNKGYEFFDDYQKAKGGEKRKAEGATDKEKQQKAESESTKTPQQPSTPKKEWFEILGVEKTATDQAIRTAYRKLVLKWHPDRFSEKSPKEKQEAKEKTEEIINAYDDFLMSRDLKGYQPSID